MANVLVLLRDLVSDDAARAQYTDDPDLYLHEKGFADLTGEDVIEALDVVRAMVPPDLDAAIGQALEHAPNPAPEAGEKPFTAATRLLGHVVGSLDPV